MTPDDADLLALHLATNTVQSGDLIQTSAGNLDPTWYGRQVLVGCYPPAILGWVDQLRVLGLVHLYTDQGFIEVPAIAPVSCARGCAK